MFLGELYHSLKTPGALGGADGFYKTAKGLNPQITKKQVQEFLKTQRTYTLHKPIRKPKVNKTNFSIKQICILSLLINL